MCFCAAWTVCCVFVSHMTRYDGVCTLDSPGVCVYARLTLDSGPMSILYLSVTTLTQASLRSLTGFPLLNEDVRRTWTYGSPELSTVPHTSMRTVPRMLRLRIEATCTTSSVSGR